jgi:hypothetical protein
MECNVTTMYNIGCLVFVPIFRDGYTVVGPYTISSIEIDITAERTKVAYGLNDGETFIGCFSEDKLFRSYDECAQWCKGR